MAWLEQCDVCGGGGFFCCRHNSHPPDLNQEAAGAACPHEGGGPGPGLVPEFQFLERRGGGVGWLLGDACRDGEVVSEDIRRPPPIVPTAVWDADCRYGPCSPRWPILDSCSISGSSKTPLAEAAVDGAAASAGAAVSLFDASNPGKDESSSIMDREARVLRYREKKKRRKFGKQIRYASRKAYAEARPRIRGRFVKAPEEMAQPPAPPPPRYDAQQMDMGWLRAFRP